MKFVQSKLFFRNEHFFPMWDLFGRCDFLFFLQICIIQLSFKDYGCEILNSAIWQMVQYDQLCHIKISTNNSSLPNAIRKSAVQFLGLAYLERLFQVQFGWIFQGRISGWLRSYSLSLTLIWQKWNLAKGKDIFFIHIERMLNNIYIFFTIYNSNSHLV